MARKWRSEFSTKTDAIVKDNFPSMPDMSFTETSVLARAIHFENVNEVRFLLKKGSDSNKPSGQKRMRPLMMACFVSNSSRRIAIFKILFCYKVDPELSDAHGHNSLMYVCALRLRNELLEILDRCVCSFYNSDQEGNNLLHICARYSTVNIMELVLEKMLHYNVNINVPNKNGHTPLDLAILYKNVECAERLVKGRGQSTLPYHSQSYDLKFIKGDTGQEVHAIKSAPLKAKMKELIFPSKDRAQSSLPSYKDIISPNCFPMTSDSFLSEDIKHNDVIIPSVQSLSGFEKISVQDPDEVLYHLLELKSKMTPGESERCGKRVPLDDEWIEKTKAHLDAIASMDKYMLESIAKAKNEKSATKETMSSQGMLNKPQQFPARLWRRVLVLNTATRSMSPCRVPINVTDEQECCEDEVLEKRVN